MNRKDIETQPSASSVIKKVRSSNLELFRIISMLLIIAHHYVVNSGLIDADGPIYLQPLSIKSFLVLLLGAWGKTGINCFMMITGYFMCKSNITLKKYAKLVIEVFFYRIVIYAIAVCTGLQAFSLSSLVQNLLIVKNIQQNFTGCFLVFYLFIPFLTIVVKNLNEKQHIRLLVLLGFTYVLFGTLPKFKVDMNYVSWFAVIYFIASYIRLYPHKSFSSKKLWGVVMAVCVFLSAASVICCTWLSFRLNNRMAYFFVSDSNNTLAVLTGVASFMFFKNLSISYSKLINTLGASTFGVLLIHTNDNIRDWLWNNLLKNTEVYNENYIYIHAAASVIGIFTICTIIDVLRIRFIESPVMKFLDKKYESIKQWYELTENKLFNKLNVK